MMKITTKYLGEIEIDESKRIKFESGIPGFPEETSFILLNFPGDQLSAFQVLQSLNTPDLAFIVTNPYYFYEDYEFELEGSLVEQLGIINEEDVIVLTIVTVKSPFSNSTINLKAPLIINYKTRLGKQFILQTDQYETRAPISVPQTEEGK